jgi:hypothetical protein
MINYQGDKTGGLGLKKPPVSFIICLKEAKWLDIQAQNAEYAAS